MKKDYLEVGDKIIREFEDAYTYIEVERVTPTKAILSDGTTFKRSLAKGLMFYNSLRSSEYKYELVN